MQYSLPVLLALIFLSVFNTSYANSNIPVPQLSRSGTTSGEIDTNGAYTIKWNDADSYGDLARYELYENNSRVYGGKSLSKVFSGKSSGNYTYKVRMCRTGLGCGSFSSAVTVRVQPISTPNLSYSQTTSGNIDVNGVFTIKWNSTDSYGDLARYELYQNGSWVYSGKSLSKSFSGMSAGNYSYKIRMCRSGLGCGSYSSTITVRVQPISKPRLSYSQATSGNIDVNGAFTINWSNTDTYGDLARYELYQNGSWVYSGKSLSRSFSGMSAGDYSYKVRMCRSGLGCGSYSSTVTIRVQPISVPSLSYSQTTSGNIDVNGVFTINWSNADTYGDLSKYELYQNGSLVYSGKNLSKSFSGISAGNYSYKIRMCRSGLGCGSYSSTVTIRVQPISVPSLSYSQTTSGNIDVNGAFTINWSNTDTYDDLAKYELYQNGSWVYSGKSLSKSFSGLAAGNYSYKARMCRTGLGCGPHSTTKTVRVEPISTPAITIVSDTLDDLNVESTFTINWQDIDRYNDLEKYELVENETVAYAGKNLTKAFSSKAPGQYSYKLRMCRTGLGCGAFSNTISIQVKEPVLQLSAPSYVTATVVNQDGIYIEWSSVEGASEYRRQYKVGNGEWVDHTIIHYGTSVSFADQIARKTTYRVKACAEDNCSDWTVSNEIEITEPSLDAPSVVSALAENDTIIVEWSQVQGAIEYKRQNMNADGIWGSEVFTEYGTSVTLQEQEAGTTAYRIKACNERVCSDWRESNLVTVTKIQRKVIFIHTDLLGSPVLETRESSNPF